MIYAQILEKYLAVINKLRFLITTLLHKPRFHTFGEKSKLGRNCLIMGGRKIKVGKKVTIGNEVWLNAGDLEEKVEGQTLIIGDGVYISARTHINAFKDVVIEDNVLIGEDVYIGDTDHNYSENRPINQQGWNFKGSILIGNGSYICKGAVVLPGIEVGQNSVVGPYAVVTRNVPEHTLAMGNPARYLPIKSSN